MFSSLRTIIAAAAVAGSLPAVAQAQTADHSAHNVAAQPVRNVVLVHGAFADGSGCL
jgi:hypothetical protein